MTSAEWHQVATRGQAELAGLFALQRDIWSVVDVGLADLCRRRILQLLHAPVQLELATAPPAGADTSVTAADLVNWPRAGVFDARQRAALAFAEQLVVDVGAVDQALVDRLLDGMTAGECYALVTACWLSEAVARACLVLDIVPPAHAVAVV